MIHLAGPVVLVAALAGAGVYGLLARRNVVLVLVGAELLLNAAGLLLIIASTLPARGLAGLGTPGAGDGGASAADPLLSGQVMTIVLVTIAAAEIGLALAVVLLLFRRRATSDVTAVRELGEASATYTDYVPDETTGTVSAAGAAAAPGPAPASGQAQTPVPADAGTTS